MEELAILLALAATANKTVSVIKSLFTEGSRNTALTQLLVWGVAFVVVGLAATAQITETYVLPGLQEPLGSLDFPSLVMLAWIIGSSGSVIFYDFKKAIDSSDSAAEPRLFS